LDGERGVLAVAGLPECAEPGGGLVGGAGAVGKGGKDRKGPETESLALHKQESYGTAPER